MRVTEEQDERATLVTPQGRGLCGSGIVAAAMYEDADDQAAHSPSQAELRCLGVDPHRPPGEDEWYTNVADFEPGVAWAPTSEEQGALAGFRPGAALPARARPMTTSPPTSSPLQGAFGSVGFARMQTGAGPPVTPQRAEPLQVVRSPGASVSHLVRTTDQRHDCVGSPGSLRRAVDAQPGALGDRAAPQRPALPRSRSPPRRPMQASGDVSSHELQFATAVPGAEKRSQPSDRDVARVADGDSRLSRQALRRMPDTRRPDLCTQLGSDPTRINSDEEPELLEACVRAEVLLWMRETAPAHAARTQVMRRLGAVPPWSVDAVLADNLDPLAASMAPLLSPETRVKLQALPPWAEFVVLKSAAMFVPFWRRTPDSIGSLLADLARDSVSFAANGAAAQRSASSASAAVGREPAARGTPRAH